MKWLWWRARAPSLILIGACLCAVALIVGKSLAAPEVRRAAPSSSSQVIVRFVTQSADGGEVAELFEAIIAARRDDVTVVFEREPDTSAWNDAVWVALDAERPTAWRLTLHHGSRRFERELGTGIETDAAAVEAAALVAARGVLALLERPEAELADWQEVERGEALPVAKVPSQRRTTEDAPAPQAPWGSLILGVGYEPVMFSEQSLVESGVAVSVGVSTRAGLELELSAAAYPDVEIASEVGSFRLSHWPAQATAGWVFGVGDLRFGPRAGALLELRRRHSITPSPFVGATGGASTVHPGATLQGFLQYWFAARWSLALGLGADWVPGQRYVAAGDSGPLLEPREIRPRANLSVRYQLPLGAQ